MVTVTTNKIAHFNIPDLHAFHSLANRIDYNSEILSIVQRLGLMVTKYKQEGYQCIALLNGDVAHRGSTKDTLNDYASQIIKLLISYFDETYLNFGNHEFTYYKNNPILKFIRDIEDPRIRKFYPHIVGTSLTPDIKVVPELTYTDIGIGFTPYGMVPAPIQKKYRHMVMHDDLMSDNALNRLTFEMPEYKIHRRVLMPDEYDYVYCGHAHLVCEQWNMGETLIYNMASLGRSNAAEVRDDMRHRIIPVIVVEDGYFKEVIEEPLTLHKRVDVIDEEKLLKSQLAYQATKARKETRESLTINQSVNPLEALMDDVHLSENPFLISIMDIIKQGRLVNYKEVNRKVEEITHDGD